MKRIVVVGVLISLLSVLTFAWAQYPVPSGQVASKEPVSATAQFVNKEPLGTDVTAYVSVVSRLKGRLVDHTKNHGKDNRIWSRAMHQWRDMYVYLPPGYSQQECYPFMLFLHPVAMDERFFLHIVPLIDEAIMAGKLPPIIVAAPDGSLDGIGTLHKPASFFLNSGSGLYEDFILQDVWDFVAYRYPIRTERGAHVLCGASVGGFAAFNLGLRFKQCFGSVIGIHPPVNMRWADVDGNPRAKFDPRRWGWRTGFDTPHENVAVYYGAFKIPMRSYIGPVFGVGDEALFNISNNNPLELLLNTGYRNGELNMFIGYAGRDEFNIDAQVESFLYYCKFKGIGVAVAFEPDGHHDTWTALKLFPSALAWLGPHIAPFAPCLPKEIHPPLNRQYPVPRELPPPGPPIPPRYPTPAEVTRPPLVTPQSQYPQPGKAPPPPKLPQIPQTPMRYPGIGW